MGDFQVRTIKNAADRANMLRYVLDDIKALEIMIAEGLLGDTYPQIGVEQEICLVNNQFLPATNNLRFLDHIDDARYTNELALFNLEANLAPLDLRANCFRKTETDLVQLLDKGQKLAASFDNHLLLCGILPTLKYRHLQFEYMTPVPRYQALSKVLSDLRGSKFEIYLQGVDDLNLSLESMLFEACNTSFQMHLLMQASTFVDKYNWAQMIAGPVLSISANSPLLFGCELWAETRIALFKQSIDTRSSSNQLRKKMPRVFFGEDWLQRSPVDLLKEEVQRFPFILTSDNFESSTESLQHGKVPDLRAVRIHNGTTYTWNRLCYGNPDNQPHLRIECRYLPAGPSPIDEIANFAFWVGLIQGQPDHLSDFWRKLDFKSAKYNFIKAARYGSQVVFDWFGEKITAKQLILEQLLPMAKNGLEKFQVDPADIEKYLSVIEQRVEKETNGADWQVRNFRSLQKSFNTTVALKELTAHAITFQKANVAVHEWPDLSVNTIASSPHPVTTVEEVMLTDILTISPDDSLGAAVALLAWNPIQYLPVENEVGEIIGLLTDSHLESIRKNKLEDIVLVREIMFKEVRTIGPECTLREAEKIMKQEKRNVLAVAYQKKLIGILTKEHLQEKP